MSSRVCYRNSYLLMPFLVLDGKSIFHCSWPHSLLPSQSALTSSSYRHRPVVYSRMRPSSSQQACCLSPRIIFSHVDAAFACWEIAPICPSSQSRMNRPNNSQGAFGQMEMRTAAPLGGTDIGIILHVHVAWCQGWGVLFWDKHTLLHVYCMFVVFWGSEEWCVHTNLL